MIFGYKCFNEELNSYYGDRFEEGKTQHVDGEIKFNQNGFHMCVNLEDTLRYFNTFENNVLIAYVCGYGKVNKRDDTYYDYYDMYAVEYIKIIHVLSREEIINYGLSLPYMRLLRFISLFRLNSDEIELFKEKFYNDKNIIDTIDYYQNNKKDVYMKKKY